MATADMVPDDEFGDADEIIAQAEVQIAAERVKEAWAFAKYIGPNAPDPAGRFPVGRGDATFHNRKQLRDLGCDWTGDRWVASSTLLQVACVAMIRRFPDGAPQDAVDRLRDLFGIPKQQRGIAIGAPPPKPLETMSDPQTAMRMIGTALGGGGAPVGISSEVAASVAAGQAQQPRAPKASPAAPVPQPAPAGSPRPYRAGLSPVLATDLGPIRQGHIDAIKGVPTEALIYELRRRNVLDQPIETFGEAVEEHLQLTEDLALDDAFETDWEVCDE